MKWLILFSLVLALPVLYLIKFTNSIPVVSYHAGGAYETVYIPVVERADLGKESAKN